MNFLAHFQLATHLSNTHHLDAKQQIAGAFMADFYRGTLPEPEEIGQPELVPYWRAVYIHRHVDSFTDHHPTFLKTKGFFSSAFRHYTPVLIDVFFDAVLAKHFTTYRIPHTSISPEQTKVPPLTAFSHWCYQLLAEHYRDFPELWNDESLDAFRHMQSRDWLSRYATMAGIEKTLAGLSERFRKPINLVAAIPDFIAHEEDFISAFATMWPDVQREIVSW